jgi:hypothetical protein
MLGALSSVLAMPRALLTAKSRPENLHCCLGLEEGVQTTHADENSNFTKLAKPKPCRRFSRPLLYHQIRSVLEAM